MSKISIIIPVYNSERYLKKCLYSVQQQTYENLEIICINDGSIDNSLKELEECRKIDDRIIIINKKNEGVSAARNDGIKISTGEYIAFVDSDDWLESDAIKTLYDTIIRENVDVVRGNYYKSTTYNKNNSIGKLYDLKNTKLNCHMDFDKKLIDKLLNGKILSYTWLLLINKKVLDKTCLFNTNLHMMEDAVFFINLITKIKNIYILDKPIYHYYTSNNNSATKSTKYYLRNMYNVIEANKCIKKTIEDSKFSSKERIIMLNTVHCNSVINYIFLMYRNESKNKKKLIKIMEEIADNEYMTDIFNNMNKNSLAIHLKIPILLIEQKKFNLLMFFYNFRNLMAKLRDKVR